MNINLILPLVKERLGIKTSARDTYLTAIINGIYTELVDEKGLVLSGTNPYHLLFIVDYVSWRFENPGSENGMPRHLQFRMHNLIIHTGSEILAVDYILVVDVLPDTPVENTVYILPDDTRQMFIDGAWISVVLVNGRWVTA